MSFINKRQQTASPGKDRSTISPTSSPLVRNNCIPVNLSGSTSPQPNVGVTTQSFSFDGGVGNIGTSINANTHNGVSIASVGMLPAIPTEYNSKEGRNTISPFTFDRPAPSYAATPRALMDSFVNAAGHDSSIHTTAARPTAARPTHSEEGSDDSNSDDDLPPPSNHITQRQRKK